MFVCIVFLFFIDFWRVFSYLDVPSLCRCARVSKYWNQIALDGSNWQHVDLFSFQTDIEVIHGGELWSFCETGNHFAML